MKSIYVKEKTVKYKTEILEIDEDLRLVLEKANSRITSQMLVEKKRIKIDKKKNAFKIKYPEKLKWLQWGYYSNGVFDEIKTKHFREIDSCKFELDVNKELQKNDKLDKNRILWFDRSSHLIYRYGQDAPISGIYVFDYIGGVNNRDFDIEKAYKHLKKRKTILKVKMIDIPYYNSEPGYTKGLEMDVLLPQHALDKIWAEVKKDNYPSVRLKEFIIPKHWIKNPIDPLGLKKFMRTKKEIEERESWTATSFDNPW